MAKSNYIIVRADGLLLDELRLEASRITGGKRVDWWVDRTEKGACFYFEDVDAKRSFVSICEHFGVSHRDG
jgi:hypothetical protein